MRSVSCCCLRYGPHKAWQKRCMQTVPFTGADGAMPSRNGCPRTRSHAQRPTPGRALLRDLFHSHPLFAWSLAAWAPSAALSDARPTAAAALCSSPSACGCEDMASRIGRTRSAGKWLQGLVQQEGQAPSREGTIRHLMSSAVKGLQFYRAWRDDTHLTLLSRRVVGCLVRGPGGGTLGGVIPGARLCSQPSD